MIENQTEAQSSATQEPTLTIANYGKSLRVIGQELTGLFPRVLEITADGAGFAVTGECHPNPFEAVKENFFMRAWKTVFPSAAPTDAAPLTPFARGFSGDEVDRLDQINSTRRSEVSRRADTYSLAERLRTMGAIVDRNQGRLKVLRKEADRLFVEYWDAQGEIKNAKLTTVIMYRNQQRIDALRQNNPTELWEGYDF
ncbi:MAG: hypothetical protein EXR70_21510 [Deltaproteobacteria bacterium]|nr:hypothetical protein [Deltaproteobacteria bacterium]